MLSPTNGDYGKRRGNKCHNSPYFYDFPNTIRQAPAVAVPMVHLFQVAVRRLLVPTFTAAAHTLSPCW